MNISNIFRCVSTLPSSNPILQLLPNTWSVVVSVCPEGTSATITPLQEIKNLPNDVVLGSESGCHRLDPSYLCYDPRGWWNYASAAGATSARASSSCRLYRPHRGLSTSGLRPDAGSLNVPLRSKPSAAEENTMVNLEGGGESEAPYSASVGNFAGSETAGAWAGVWEREGTDKAN